MKLENDMDNLKYRKQETGTVLVTGGLGFIGSHLVDKLIQYGYQVVVIDDLSTGVASRRNSDAKYALSSLLDNEALTKLFFKYQFDTVYHLAAWARVQRSVDDPLGTNNVNVVGTLNLLNMIRKYPGARVVYASSSSVYGMQNTHVMRETLPANPLSPYAVQKWQGEQWGKLYSDLFGIPFVALRFFNVYGPRQLIDGPYSLVIGKFLQQKSQKQLLSVYGDGKQTRAYTYVKDVVGALVQGGNVVLPNMFEAINIGSEVETSVLEIAELVGGDINHIFPNPRGKFEEDRKVSDSRKALELLGWKAETNIKEGIHECIAYQENSE